MNPWEKEQYERMPNRYTREEAVKFVELFEAEYKPEYLRVIMSSMMTLEGAHSLEGFVTGNMNQFFTNFCYGLFQEDDYGKNPAIDLVFNVALEDVPLYVNDPKKYLQVIARWRLTIGR